MILYVHMSSIKYGENGRKNLELNMLIISYQSCP